KNIVTDHGDSNTLDSVDGCFIGGSSEYAGCDIFEGVETLELLLKEIHQKQIPCFGICFGGQFIAKTFGGAVVRDESRQELGTYTINTTAEAAKDSVFKTLPAAFSAQEAHNYYIASAPKKASVFAVSDRCPIQAFRLKDAPMYGTLFHPEMNANDLRTRITASSGYTQSPDHEQTVLAGLRDTPEAASLIRTFIETVVIPRKNQT
ncbi:MAG: type 1 glutamine amidotransferase, partial [bacterium]|nr:type 1 glutamine amidotransferase [bacterium]